MRTTVARLLGVLLLLLLGVQTAGASARAAAPIAYAMVAANDVREPVYSGDEEGEEDDDEEEGEEGQ